MSALDTPIGAVPGVGAPAARALAEQGITTVDQLVERDWAELAELHGTGWVPPRAGGCRPCCSSTARG
ncbi:helix-hairpin-helix domain-containing protein [Brachybacterium paraconglomeratum]|uniref:helix-hairpin-helix domain-containing protein n=1 Tax=Brachybacterium paraconglomeratum TaxID=173362 RepID=UPI0022AF38E6|nr:helix-hairpin-helix domain-containing protein [Brachybacterium paraconglomeratum]MCZ4325875.1 helix-hairpin-helix domain-containing protein [Brachybacterium paraconglomeratum]